MSQLPFSQVVTPWRNRHRRLDSKGRGVAQSSPLDTCRSGTSSSPAQQLHRGCYRPRRLRARATVRGMKYRFRSSTSRASCGTLSGRLFWVVPRRGRHTNLIQYSVRRRREVLAGAERLSPTDSLNLQPLEAAALTSAPPSVARFAQLTHPDRPHHLALTRNAVLRTARLLHRVSRLRSLARKPGGELERVLLGVSRRPPRNQVEPSFPLRRLRGRGVSCRRAATAAYWMFTATRASSTWRPIVPADGASARRSVVQFSGTTSAGEAVRAIS